MASSKGISAHQLMRNPRARLLPDGVVHGASHPRSHVQQRPGALGGKDKTVEVGETYISGKPADTFVSGRAGGPRGTAQVSTGNGTYIV